MYLLQTPGASEAIRCADPEVMHLFYTLLVLLVVTRICSEIAVRLKLPPLVGELFGGIFLGVGIAVMAESPEFLSEIDSDQTIQAVLDLAVFFLMLLAGIEMRPKDLVDASARAVPVAVVGMVVPLALGLAIGWWWLPESDWKMAQSLFIGVALAITAVPVAVRVLLDIGQLQSRVGQVIVAAALMDDIMSLALLAVLTGIIGADEPLSAMPILMISLNVGVFFAVAWASGRYLLPWIGRRVQQLDLEHAEFSLLIIYALALSVVAEALDMHFLIGAFAAGVFFNRNIVGSRTYERLKTQSEAVTMGFLAPIFFASIGIHLDLAAVVEAPAFVLLLLLAATVGKLVGAGVVARLTGFESREALAIGAAMNARGAVEIIIAGIALQAGLFDKPVPTPASVEYLFSAIVIVAIVTTVATPLMLRKLLPNGRASAD